MKCLGRISHIIIERVGTGETNSTRLGKRILVRAEIHEDPSVLGLLFNKVLDMRPRKCPTPILLTVRLDDEYDTRLGGMLLDCRPDRIEQGGRPAWSVRLVCKWFNIDKGHVRVDLLNFMIKLNESHLTPDSLLVRHERIESADRVVPANLHRTGSVQKEDERSFHLLTNDPGL